jgi:methionyl-tRNA formyltransferase
MTKEYLFIGNRYNVYEQMLNLGLKITNTYAVGDSFLERELQAKNIKYEVLPPKKQLIEELKIADFDTLISNGCPYILPISELQDGKRTFVNIHPSLLPDLKGITPINGAILFSRQAGATCHLMDDGVDTGLPIAYVPIGNANTLTLGLLYRLSFEAEGAAFVKAYKRNFKPLDHLRVVADPIYYSRKDIDLEINFEESPDDTVRRIKAFGVSSQGARFSHNGKSYIVLDAEIIKNKLLENLKRNTKNFEVIYKYGTTLLIKYGSIFLELRNIQDDISQIHEGDILSTQRF